MHLVDTRYHVMRYSHIPDQHPHGQHCGVEVAFGDVPLPTFDKEPPNQHRASTTACASPEVKSLLTFIKDPPGQYPTGNDAPLTTFEEESPNQHRVSA